MRKGVSKHDVLPIRSKPSSGSADDAGGNQTLQQVIEHNTAEFIECKKESCGAWRDGKCHYNQVD